MKQLTHIERRQFELRNIRERVEPSLTMGNRQAEHRKPILSAVDHHGPANKLYGDYCMSESEDDSIHLPTFLQVHGKDPAVKVSFRVFWRLPRGLMSPKGFLSKLRGHLFERLQAIHRTMPVDPEDAAFLSWGTSAMTTILV